MLVNPSSMLIVCGETSSDEHMAPVLECIRAKLPQTNFFGMGGAHLQAAGMELTVDARVSASVMGITEVVHKLGDIYKAFQLLLTEVDKRTPALAVLVDFPDFNLRLAKKLKERGVTVVYFITPQLWAWRKGRIHQMKKYVDAIIPIFPFEVPFYSSHGIDARFLGHPFTDKTKPEMDKKMLCEKIEIPLDTKILALLPGSRKAEIEKILPVMGALSDMLAKTHPDVTCVVPIAPSVAHIVDQMKHSMPHICWIVGHAREVLHNATAGVIASGTATVEASLSKIPFCICYKVSTLTFMIGKLLIRGVRFIGMPNLIAGKEVVREYIQGNCTSEELYKEVKKLIEDEPYRTQICKELERVNTTLTLHGETSVSERVAEEIVAVLGRQSAHCPFFNAHADTRVSHAEHTDSQKHRVA